MPNKRDLRMERYSIGKYAYRELHNFCLQYPDKKRRLRELQSRTKAPKSQVCRPGAGQETQPGG